MTEPRPTINPALFRGADTAPPEPPSAAPLQPEVPKSLSGPPQAPRPAGPRRGEIAPARAEAVIEPTARRYRRLNLYATDAMLRRIKQIQAEALTAELPLGQRGASVVMAAALNHLAALPRAERLEAIRRVL